MLAIIYLILASVAGFCTLTIFSSELFNIDKGNLYRGKAIELKPWMAVKPASFLIGILFMTWITYIGSWIFKGTTNPMLYGNIISFSLTIGFILWAILKNNKTKENWQSFLSNDLFKYRGFSTDAIFVLTVLALSAFIMFYTFYVKDGIINAGFTVFSDFGPHLSVIRSFSYGANFPTEYPHFPAGNIRYHFMFQFLTGNLESLGLRIDWAFNIVSTISLVSFVMLLHSLAVTITGKRWIGIITSILFFFRSSLAFFTYTEGATSFSEFINKIFKVNKFIGRTTHEDWGLWAQNVYANQRHFAFSLGIFALIIVLLVPLVKKMSVLLKERWNEIDSDMEAKESNSDIESTGNGTIIENNTISSSISSYKALIIKLVTKYIKITKFYLFSPKMWSFENAGRAVFIGALLGLIAFWNGAVLIGGLCILFVLALFSVSRLEYITIAGMSVVLSSLQSAWFIGKDSSPVKPEVVIGFLAKTKDFIGISEYYFELLGIFIFVLVLAWFVLPRLRVFTLAFIAPLIFANTLLLTPDIAVNHKYIMISAMFLNIIVATFIYKLISSNKKETGVLTSTLILLIGIALLIYKDVAQASGNILRGLILTLVILTLLYFAFKKSQRIISILIGAMLLLTMTSTGIVDLLTLYNVDKNTVKYDMNDPILKWVEQNTKSDEIFLTPPYVCHPILLAGRKIFFGWPYFTWSAGYDTNARSRIVEGIYGGKDSGQVKRLVEKGGIDYIVIEDENRKSELYKLNEELIKNTFKLVYEDKATRYEIYKCD